eukprot:3603361-Amphidinium_carterae.1
MKLSLPQTARAPLLCGDVVVPERPLGEASPGCPRSQEREAGGTCDALSVPFEGPELEFHVKESDMANGVLAT